MVRVASRTVAAACWATEHGDVVFARNPRLHVLVGKLPPGCARAVGDIATVLRVAVLVHRLCQERLGQRRLGVAVDDKHIDVRVEEGVVRRRVEAERGLADASLVGPEAEAVQDFESKKARKTRKGNGGEGLVYGCRIYRRRQLRR
jgi:hypothetical protein